MGVWGDGGAIFYMGGQGWHLWLKVTVDQTEVINRRKSISGRENSKGKGPKVGALLNCSETSKGARVDGAEPARGRGVVSIRFRRAGPRLGVEVLPLLHNLILLWDGQLLESLGQKRNVLTYTVKVPRLLLRRYKEARRPAAEIRVRDDVS